MPFVATTADGEAVAPPQADRDAEYECPECNDVLTVRRAHERDGHFVCRHFWHPNGRNGCEGESDEHRRMKSATFSKAEQRWPSASVEYESVVDNRRADVLVEFDDVDERLGEGLALECQHRNEGKDVEAVTDDFLDAGYSVLWLEADHFDGMDVDLDAGDWRVWWSRQVPPGDEWSGYHGVVYWLWQEKPRRTDIQYEMEELPDFPPERELKKGWMRGVCNSKVSVKRDMVLTRGPIFHTSDMVLYSSYTGGLNLKLIKASIKDKQRAFVEYDPSQALRLMAIYIEEWQDRLRELDHYVDSYGSHDFRLDERKVGLGNGWTTIRTKRLSENWSIHLKSTPDLQPTLTLEGYKANKTRKNTGGFFMTVRAAPDLAPNTLRDMADFFEYLL